MSNANNKKSTVDAVIADQQQSGITASQLSLAGTQKQSFLSKFARSEVKSSKSIDKSTHLNRSSDSNNNSSKVTLSNNQDDFALAANNKSAYEPDCDKNLPESTRTKSGLGTNLFPNRACKSFCETDSNDQNRTVDPALKILQQRTNNADSSNNHQADDDNDQVLPFWPSKIDSTTLEPSMFQVYSLKDYSQVSGPTENVASSTAGGRLLKSMSQDRKVDSRSKRMSECIFSSQTAADSKATNQARQQRLPSMVGKVSTTNLSTMGPATSVNSLLPQTKNPALISESRIDRMRKLFVSPLSLRGSSGGKSSQAHQASSHSRLSLQAGANMLNKPHHIMHAMYRTRAGAGPQYSRRSPMRQKPGSVRGFRVYGCPLSMANTMYPITCFGRPDIYKQQSVPYILARLCYFIEENSSQLTHEGIFRVSGNARLMEKLKTLFDHLGDAPLESESVDVATSASMLKMYLRELPDPLIPTRMNYHFFTLAKKYSSILSKNSLGYRAPDNLATASGTMNEPSSISDGQSTLDRQKLAFMRDLTKLIRKLPIENYNLLKYLACFLHRISLKQQSNKMSAEALGIVFGPNVFRIRSESYKGLKEQELGNQVMASIISNYKQIFDCELTDALGNLVQSDDLDQTSRDREVSETRGNINQSELSDLHKEATSSRGLKMEKSPPIPTTSNAYAFSSKQRCARHDHPVGYHHSDEDSDEDDEINEHDVDGEECDDGSYSQTSDSGSYCSSMASESIESIYEGNGDGEQFDEDDDEFLPGSGTSSECGSETSYTPSSSHSDTNANEIELSSSNFSSNASLAGTKDDETSLAQIPKPCLVCKRRESAQIEASKLKEQIQLNNLTMNAKKESKELADTIQESKPATLAVSSMVENVAGQNQLMSKSSARMSTRRKRLGDNLESAIITNSDITLDTKNTALTPAQARPNKHSGHHQSKHDQRHGLLRRRSSSASSLLRIANRLDHASRKRSVGREDHHSHRSRVHADRRKCNEARGYNRRSRNKCYQARKDAHGSKLYSGRTHQADGSKIRANAKSHAEWQKGDCYVPELLALNMRPESRDDLVWSYVSPSFLGLPDEEQFYQLRSYNSDETLLRSQDCATNSSIEAASRARRRFSGQDYLKPNQESLLANLSSQFQEISETYEGESANYEAENTDELLNESRRLDLFGGVKSSVVSLLSDQLVNFKHSTLSLNDELSDPIVCQLKVIKELVRLLEKLMREADSRGLGQEISARLFKLANYSDSEEQLDNIATSGVDYLTAKNIISILHCLAKNSEQSPKIDVITQDRLVDLVTIQVGDLKKRYNNLKYIREHYYKHHTKPRHQIENIHGEQSKDVNKPYSQIDSQSMTSDVSSFGSLNHPSASDQDGRPIAVDRQASDATLIADSCKFGSLCPVEFVFNIEKQLASRRRSGSRLVRLNDMTLAQLQSEKLELQKNLLRYEHWFGRPSTKSDFNLIGHLYERYRAIKIIKQQRQAYG